MSHLRPSESELVRQTRFAANGLQHEFQVIRIWEQPTQTFLQRPGLLPYAVLSQTDSPSRVLREVAQTIDALPQRRQQANIIAATGILAGLVLEKQLVQRLLRRELMQESAVYLELREEARAEGMAQGKAEGIAQGKAEGIAQGKAEGIALGRAEGIAQARAEVRLEEARALVLRLLRRRLGDLPDVLAGQLNRLTLDQLEALAEDLLDFSTLADLQSWLEQLPQ